MRTLIDRTPKMLRHAAWLAMVVLVLTACSDQEDPAGPPTRVPVASVQVTAPALAMVAGASMQLTGTPLSAAGDPITGRTVTWSSGDEEKATVSAGGLVTAHRIGQVAIRATVEGRMGEVVLTIQPGAPVWINVTPGPISLAPGAAQQLHATPMDENMNEIPGLQVTWSSSNEAVASVTPGGVVAAHTPGTARITASVGEHSGHVEVTVSTPRLPVAYVVVVPGESPIWVNGTVRLTARTLAASGGELEGRQVTWSADNAAIATVGSDGTVTGVAPGITRIRAHSEGKSGWASVEVRERPTGSIHDYRLDGLEEWRTPWIHIGSQPWTDPSGVEHAAYQVVTGGTFRLLLNQPGGPRWQQSVRVDVFLVGGDPTVPVHRIYLNDHGRVLYDLYTGEAMLESTAQPGTVFRTRPHRDGERILDQKLEIDTGTRAWVWVFKGN